MKLIGLGLVIAFFAGVFGYILGWDSGYEEGCDAGFVAGVRYAQGRRE